ncbi:glutathione S-transferase family protein [Kordiimonas laminariae]|uniref:glutathione S-transferase family protein n=1 Tax=Kordiimonas laminariae TaxID=2917717 RepID=UPI001FF0FE97|nr:glutathione S-transferase family protein [Kordiimonas laminariae]MCK0068554.1 glutathione S-transferase family protein [Kordiimonas laminariae]
MTDITLYGYVTSPYVRKVSAYLYYKDLDFKFVHVSPVEPYKTIGFTEGTQVPVLKVGSEWRTDSSKLGIWLEELFPEKSLLGVNAAERETILKIDKWASEQFIPGMVFRSAVEGEVTEAFNKRAWRLAEIVSAGASLPEEIQKAWPQLLRQAPFIKALVAHLDGDESLEAMQMRIFGELVNHLGEGPFLGELDQPSLADFAVYPQMAFMYQAGIVKDLPPLMHPTVGPWLRRMAKLLPENPWCVDEKFLVNRMPA